MQHSALSAKPTSPSEPLGVDAAHSRLDALTRPWRDHLRSQLANQVNVFLEFSAADEDDIGAGFGKAVGISVRDAAALQALAEKQDLRGLGIKMNGQSSAIPTLLASLESIVANNPNLRTLQLDMEGCPLDAASLSQLARFSILEALNLCRCGLDAESIGGLVRHSILPRLAVLDLSGNRLGEEGTKELAISGAMPALQHLDLCLNEIGDAGVGHLVQSGSFSNLIKLGLAANRITSRGIADLAQWHHVSQSGAPEKLQSLNLSWNTLSDADAEALAQATYLSSLESLNLRTTGMTAKGAETLRQAPCLGRLRELHYAAI